MATTGPIWSFWHPFPSSGKGREDSVLSRFKIQIDGISLEMEDVMRSIFPVGDVLKDDDLQLRQVTFISTTAICGPPMTKKTALLMQAALSEVASGGQVLLVLPKKLDDVPHVHGMPEPTEDLMKKIKFLYASSGTELRDYLTMIHCQEKDSLPSLIVVDNFEGYIRSNDPNDAPHIMYSIVRILASIQDAVSYCQNVLYESYTFYSVLECLGDLLGYRLMFMLFLIINGYNRPYLVLLAPFSFLWERT